MTITLDPAVLPVIARFAHNHAAAYSPNLSADRCEQFSLEFEDYLREVGITLDVEVICGVQMQGNVILRGHFVTRIGEWTFDWTARQFYPDAPVPLIMPVAAWREQWPALADIVHEPERQT